MDRLIVKNFGPLKDVDIEMNKINLFIGDNGSGKSVLAKIITIVLDTFMNVFEEELILKKFIDFNINYIEVDTIILYVKDGQTLFSLKDKKFKIQLIENSSHVFTDSDDFLGNYINEVATLHDTSRYIPAERNLISIFNKYVTTFITADIPLPKFLLNFSSEYTRAREAYKELEFLNVKYVNSGEDRVYYSDEESLKLEHSSSGIQSALPLYLTVKYFAQKHKNIIIEEPEQNLFPKSQTETIKYIIGQISNDNNLFLMTHSPYVLSTLNILMMADKAGNLNNKSKTIVEKIISQSQWLNRDNFSAYYLENGVARNIKGKTGLISDNEIDEISEDIQYEFEELLNIYREYKNDK